MGRLKVWLTKGCGGAYRSHCYHRLRDGTAKNKKCHKTPESIVICRCCKCDDETIISRYTYVSSSFYKQ
jgi:hypothetical protein